MNKILIFIALIKSLTLSSALFPRLNNTPLKVTDLPGFSITGASSGDSLGDFVSTAGDVNGDGINDIIIGAYQATVKGRHLAGAAYVIYGTKNGFPNIDITNLTKTQGFSIFGANKGDRLGGAVSVAGDINGDGITDIIVGAYAANPKLRPQAGAAYVIYGGKGELPDIDLSELNATQGFTITGAFASNHLGSAVSNAGDVNGDGIDDILVGAGIASPLGRKFAGVVYVIFGSKKRFADIDLLLFAFVDGFKIIGSDDDDAPVEFSSAGDINGDGIDDFVVGAPMADISSTIYYGGIAYVIYGSKKKPADIDLRSFSNDLGFTIKAAHMDDAVGSSLSNAGDINGDGINDLIIGACGYNDTGAAFVIYGSKGGLPNIDLSEFNATQGFKIVGTFNDDNFGLSVSGAGDFNRDGIDDVIIGAEYYDFFPYSTPGAAYVIFGRKGGLSDIYVKDLTDNQGFAFFGAGGADRLGSSVSGIGDINGDGFDDVLVGAPGVSSLGRTGAGVAYVVFGSNTTISNSSSLILV